MLRPLHEKPWNLKPDAFADLVYVEASADTRESPLYVTGLPDEAGRLALGPYPASSSLQEALRLAQRQFGVTVRPAHEAHDPEHRCAACRLARACEQDAGLLTPLRAVPDAQAALAFLAGRDRGPLDALRERMERAGRHRYFEDAATLRNRLEAVEEIAVGRTVPSGCPAEADVFCVAREGSHRTVQIAHVREGRIRGTHTASLQATPSGDVEVLSSVVASYYRGGHFVPEVVLLSESVDPTVLGDALAGRNGHGARVRAPRRGPEAELVREVTRMGERALEAEPRSEALDVGVALERLRTRLGLRRAPRHIDYFDVSHIAGSSLVATRVAMIDGHPDPSRYARRRGKTPGLDAPAALYEAVSDSIRHQLDTRDLPDWILVEGGRQAVAAAHAALRDYGASQVQVASIVRSREEAQGAATVSRVFLPDREDAIVLPGGASELRLLERLCDEAHRYALERGATLLRRDRPHGSLHDIPGVGETRRKRLIRHFGSVDRLHVATVDELARVPGIGRSMAERIHEALHGSDALPPETRPALGA